MRNCIIIVVVVVCALLIAFSPRFLHSLIIIRSALPLLLLLSVSRWFYPSSVSPSSELLSFASSSRVLLTFKTEKHNRRTNLNAMIAHISRLV